MVYVFLANGFEETEAICPIDIMMRAGIEVELISVSDELNVVGSHGIALKAHKKINEISLADDLPELIMLPGGMPGTTNLLACRPLREIIVNASEAGVPIAAICAAPMILGKLGLLEGKRATCYGGFEKELIGAKVSRLFRVVTDGNIITGAGMGVANQFGLAIVKKIRSRKEAFRIARSIRFI
ncbi:MAG: DJ-1/PfpI family protein [Ruminococcaceae bacterium]|nr:DJ-1/PfpI family protein [Oscillospiraceae bacterium]